MSTDLDEIHRFELRHAHATHHVGQGIYCICGQMLAADDADPNAALKEHKEREWGALVAVIARTRKGERARLYGQITARMPKNDGYSHTPHREGLVDGLNIALQTIKTGAKTAPDASVGGITASDGPPTGYTELVEVLEALPTLVREKRRRESLSLREAAEQAGTSAATILRFERGDSVDFRGTALPLLKWVAS